MILLLYPLIGLNLGLDITDTTYGLSNYEFLGNIDPMWALSTFLSNVTGSLFMNLPFGGTMLGMSVYCSFVISLIALFPYYLPPHAVAVVITLGTVPGSSGNKDEVVVFLLELQPPNITL